MADHEHEAHIAGFVVAGCLAFGAIVANVAQCAQVEKARVDVDHLERRLDNHLGNHR